jgi:hypothetical protein
MRAKRETGAVAARSANSLGILSHLHEDAVVEVLRAALDAKSLSALASTSRQLCSLARGRVPVLLLIQTTWARQVVLLSHARGRPPFSSATMLTMVAKDPAECLLAGGVLIAAQQWLAMQHLNLVVALQPERLPPGHSLDLCTGPLLSALPALQQLRCLVLRVPFLGPCSAGTIGQLVQLTRLELELRDTEAAAADVRVDLGSWSRLTKLKELELNEVPAVQQQQQPGQAPSASLAASQPWHGGVRGSSTQLSWPAGSRTYQGARSCRRSALSTARSSMPVHILVLWCSS